MRIVSALQWHMDMRHPPSTSIPVVSGRFCGLSLSTSLIGELPEVRNGLFECFLNSLSLSLSLPTSSTRLEMDRMRGEELSTYDSYALLFRLRLLFLFLGPLVWASAHYSLRSHNLKKKPTVVFKHKTSCSQLKVQEMFHRHRWKHSDGHGFRHIRSTFAWALCWSGAPSL